MGVKAARLELMEDMSFSAHNYETYFRLVPSGTFPPAAVTITRQLPKKKIHEKILSVKLFNFLTFCSPLKIVCMCMCVCVCMCV